MGRGPVPGGLPIGPRCRRRAGRFTIGWMSERRYCSDLCLDAGEPMHGTAPRVDAWLLLEYAPVWRAKALADNDLASPISQWLHTQVAGFEARGLAARPQFVRRPEIDTDRTTLFVGVAGGLFRFECVGYDDMLTLDLARADTLQQRCTRVAEPHYFVCTNGQRDLCCARYGLPAYARLRELVGRRVWQTTHVGGHRFAPNVVVLPQGVLYGRVRPEVASDFVADVEAGRVSKTHVRGRSAFPPEAQAAEALLDEAVLSLVDSGDAGVVLRTSSGERRVGVTEGRTFDIVASCRDSATKRVRAFSERLSPPPASAP